MQRLGCLIGLHSMLAGGLVLFALNADAAQLTVSNNGDSGPGSLRQAVIDANGSPGPDEIVFDDGLGTITLTTGHIEVTEELVISGPSGRQAISGNDCSRIITARAFGGLDLTIENLELTDGTGSETCGGPGIYGGALSVEGRLTLENSLVADNSVDGSGGGFFVGGSLLMIDSVVRGNSTLGPSQYGGGFRVEGPVRLVNSTVSGNWTTGDDARGGGFKVSLGSTELINTIVRDNWTLGSRASGGGFHVWGLRMENSAVVNNRTEGDSTRGGGLHAQHSAEILNSTVYGNSAADEGGGVSVLGGAGYSASVHNSTISGNHSDTAGGGLQIQGLMDQVTVHSTILAGNNGPFGNFVDFVPTDMYDSLIGDSEQVIDGTGGGNVFSDSPGLNGLADNGCAEPAPVACVPTLMPMPGSPAVDTGGNPLGLTSDQRGAGYARSLIEGPDIGAHEAAVPVLSLSPASVSFGGTVLEEDSPVRPVTIANTGADDLELGMLGLAGDDIAAFTLVEDGCSGQVLPPGAACSFGLVFSPDSMRPHEAEVTVPWGASPGPALVSLRGTVRPRVIPTLGGYGLVLLVMAMVLAGLRRLG